MSFINKILDKILTKLILLRQRDFTLFVPPGHFYSPIPSLREMKADENRIWPLHRDLTHLGGIAWNDGMQLTLLKSFRQYHKDIPFKSTKIPHLRFFYENPSYSYSDAIFLYCFIRHLKPKRIIEIGSGYSTCLMIDTNELHFEQLIKITCIEPFPKLLKSLISEKDAGMIHIIDNRLQDIDISLFAKLSAGDILFVDSTHVSKTASDVNHLFFEILPSLNDGVFVHFHDIFCDFEYPKEWVYKGIAWNEAYLLRAFLQWNSHFSIVFSNTYLHKHYGAEIDQYFPLASLNTGGSIWLQKVGSVVREQ